MPASLIWNLKKNAKKKGYLPGGIPKKWVGTQIRLISVPVLSK